MFALIQNTQGQKVTLRVGGWVAFKSDFEQYGEIVEINRNRSGQTILTLKNAHGFEGDYIGGQTTTTMSADVCWVD